MCRTVRTPLACEPPSVRVARRWTRASLIELYRSLDTLVADDVGLAVSELVTNCLRADAHHLTLTITAHADELVVATTDDAPGVPRAEEPGHAVPHGRGLMIIDALTSGWGVDAGGTGQKTVWGSFVLDDADTRFACSRSMSAVPDG